VWVLCSYSLLNHPIRMSHSDWIIYYKQLHNILSLRNKYSILFILSGVDIDNIHTYVRTFLSVDMDILTPWSIQVHPEVQPKVVVYNKLSNQNVTFWLDDLGGSTSTKPTLESFMPVMPVKIQKLYCQTCIREVTFRSKKVSL
jgi:hypothetical protein